MFWDIVLDAVLDTLKVLPFIFGAFLLIEYLEKKMSDEALALRLSRRGAWGPLFGSLLGVVPQCGFSTAASNFFAGRLISVGTLIAVYFSTSDEALIILLGEGIGVLGKAGLLILFKVVFAFLFGLLANPVFKWFFPKTDDRPFEELCKNCGCEDKTVFRSALGHTLKVVALLLAVNLGLGLLMGYGGEEFLSKLFLTQSFAQPFLTALIGLVPNCAVSVLMTKLYLSGVLSFGSTLAGLATGAGLGLVVLMQNHRRPKEVLFIIVYLYVAAAICGLVLNLFF